MGDIAVRGNKLTKRVGYAKGGHVNTRRENRLEELGRVDAEKAHTSKGKRNLRDEKDRIVRELKANGGYITRKEKPKYITRKEKPKYITRKEKPKWITKKPEATKWITKKAKPSKVERPSMKEFLAGGIKGKPHSSKEGVDASARRTWGRIVKNAQPYKKGGWIQDVNKSIKKRGTKGVCTGKKFGGPTCRPGTKRYALAKTFRKMAKKRKG